MPRDVKEKNPRARPSNLQASVSTFIVYVHNSNRERQKYGFYGRVAGENPPSMTNVCKKITSEQTTKVLEHLFDCRDQGGVIWLFIVPSFTCLYRDIYRFVQICQSDGFADPCKPLLTLTTPSTTVQRTINGQRFAVVLASSQKSVMSAEVCGGLTTFYIKKIFY